MTSVEVTKPLEEWMSPPSAGSPYEASSITWSCSLQAKRYTLASWACTTPSTVKSYSTPYTGPCAELASATSTSQASWCLRRSLSPTS